VAVAHGRAQQARGDNVSWAHATSQGAVAMSMRKRLGATWLAGAIFVPAKKENTGVSLLFQIWCAGAAVIVDCMSRYHVRWLSGVINYNYISETSCQPFSAILCSHVGKNISYRSMQRKF
jgi:hypothetical protein